MKTIRVTLLLIFFSIFGSDAALKADDLICASCTAMNLVRYSSRSTCQCSTADRRVRNHVVCLRFYPQKKDCGIQLGYCCDKKDDSDLCPLCSESFTRNAECDCESQSLSRKVLKKLVTKKEALDAFCCDETKPIPRTTEPPPVLRRIRPSKYFKYRKIDSDDDDY
jgi:hypothetical protein